MTSRPAQPYLQFEKLGKSYPGVQALQDVSFSVAQGTVHALLGENGAGKSTLLKILSGAHSPTGGNLRIAGRQVAFASTAQAIEAGVAMIYQELNLVPQLSVAENLFLGHLPHSAGLIDRTRLRDMALAQLRRLGEDIDPSIKVSRLSIGRQQMIEIAKALTRGAKIIAFDEPTSSLSAREIDKLFEIIAELRRQGCAILYVTHRMEEVFRICDSATVLRDGKHVVTWESLAGVTHDAIVKAMVGRDLADIYNYQPRPQGQTVLEVENLTGFGLPMPASFRLARGEILGMFGLVGAGRTELLRLLFGAAPKISGTVRIDGRPVDIRTPRDAIRAGLVACPEDRKKEGIIPLVSVAENINLSARLNHVRLGGLIDHAWERQNAAQRAADLSVKTPSLRQLIMFLSGGNQQKAILARWLSEEIRVILLDEPTRGIDIGAKREIYAIIHALAQRGVGVVVVSSDLPEVLAISDRVLVMREGEIVGNLPRDQATPEKTLGLALPTEALPTDALSSAARVSA